MANDRPKKERPVGLFIFGWLLIITSLVHMTAFTFSAQWYWKIFSFLPDWAITVRYCGSWLLRILGLSAGAGLLTGNNLCRKIALGIAVYTLITLYWKHDYQAIVNHCRIMDDYYGSVVAAQHVRGWSFVRLSTIVYVVPIVSDLIFFGTLLFYLNRPSVKKYFERSPQ